MDYPTTREEAKKTGSKYYFTGQPCKHGHISLRKTKGACLECLKVEWAKGNETRAEYFKQYNQSEASQKAKKEYYERNKEQVIARAAARPVEQRRLHREKNIKLKIRNYTKHLQVYAEEGIKMPPPNGLLQNKSWPCETCI